MLEFSFKGFLDKKEVKHPYPFHKIQLLGRRESQQDSIEGFVFQKGGKTTEVHMVADGHGDNGEDFSATAVDLIAGDLEKNGFENEDSFKEIFLKVDEEMRELGDGGTTLSLVAIRDGIAYVANVGDSEIKIFGSRGLVDISENDRLDNDEENKRVTKLGAKINEQRRRIMSDGGSINLTRALGDYKFKPFLSPEPHTAAIPLSPTDRFLLIGSDGFWELGADETEENVKILNQLLAESETVGGAYKKINAFLTTKTQYDNVSVVIIDLQKKK